ncbi:hypothetical protein ACKPNQ_005993 [Pseudomonas aeruginosa]
MKRLLLAALTAVTLTLTGCGDSFHAESAKIRQERSPVESNTSIDNQLIEALSKDCSQAQEVISWTTSDKIIGESDNKEKYECQGDNNYFPNSGKRVHSVNLDVQWFVVGMLAFVLTGVFLFINFAASSNNTRRLANGTNKKISIFAKFMLITYMSTLTVGALSLTIMYGTGVLVLSKENRKYKESSVAIPDFSSKNEKVEAITEYLICVKSNSFSSTQDASIKLFKTTEGYGLKGTYDRCRLNVAFGVDTKGHEIAKEHQFFTDYNTQQALAVGAALQKLVADAETIAVNYQKGNHFSFGSTKFDESSLTCDIGHVASVDTYYFNKGQLADYKRYADNCLGRNFLYALSKAPNVTIDQIDEQEVKTGSRYVHICTGTLEQRSMVKLDMIKEQFKQCVMANCKDMVGTSSPYACSVALSQYQSIGEDKYNNFLTLTASDPRRTVVGSNSEQSILNTFNAVFTFLDEREYTPTVMESMLTIPVSTTKGSLTLGDVEKAFEEGDKSLLSLVTDFDFMSILNRLAGKNGIAGSTRFLTCAQHPNELIDGFDCDGVHREMQRFGANSTVLALQLELGKYIDGLPMKRKPLKAGDAALTGAKKLIDKIPTSFGSKRVAMYVFPMFLGDTVALGTDSIFESQSMSLTGNYPTVLAFMVLLDTMPDTGKALIAKASTALFITGQVFQYILPNLEYFAFFGIISLLIFKVIFEPQVAAAKFLVDLNTPPANRNLDRFDTVIMLEKIVFIGINTAIIFTLISIIFTATLQTLIGPLQDFTLGLFGYTAGFFASIMASVISIIVYVILFRLTTGLMKGISPIFEGIVYGHTAQADFRIQGEEEAKKVSRAYKGKIYG